jgi:hypothetical protein
MTATPQPYVVDVDGLPGRFPTHRHAGAFWESLGRAVATFGFLEEILGKAIFAFTATTSYNDSEIEQAYALWRPSLERALSDSLGGLITAYEAAVLEHPGSSALNLAELMTGLRNAAELRNVLCHGSWRPPDNSGSSLPFYVDRKGRIVDSCFDARSLDQIQRHVADLACAVMDTVTSMGWRFPGSGGPGRPIW